MIGLDAPGPGSGVGSGFDSGWQSRGAEYRTRWGCSRRGARADRKIEAPDHHRGVWRQGCDGRDGRARGEIERTGPDDLQGQRTDRGCSSARRGGVGAFGHTRRELVHERVRSDPGVRLLVSVRLSSQLPARQRRPPIPLKAREPDDE